MNGPCYKLRTDCTGFVLPKANVDLPLVAITTATASTTATIMVTAARGILGGSGYWSLE